MRYISAIVGSGLAAIFCFLSSFSHWKREWEADRWPSTTGRIISSELRTGYIAGKSRRLGSKTQRSLWTLLIQYEYMVEGKIHINDRYSFEGDLQSSLYKDTGEPAPWLRDLAEKLSVGQKCTVYYDIQKPQRSVLERKHTNLKFVLLAVGLVFIFICARMTYTWLRTQGQ